MKIVKLLAILVTVLFVAEAATAADYYVRDGASGSNNGSDWSNAYTSLPSSLVRGSTYYIADGSYSGKTFSTSESGSTVITIKKATPGDHGTNTGWQNSYGDGQATFSRLSWTSGYWVFDGSVRNDSDWSDSTAYGFVVNGGSGGNDAKLLNIDGSHITIRNTYAYYSSVLCSGSDISANRDQGLYLVSGSGDITLENSYIKNISWKSAIQSNPPINTVVVKYNYFENICKKELFSARSVDNVTFAYNFCKNVAGTGAIVADDSDNWDIYGNVFWSPSSSYSFTDVIIGTWTGDHPSRNETLNNWKIYNNTFYQMHGATQIQIQHGSGNVVANNLFIGFSSSINGSLTNDHNDQNQSVSLVVNADFGNFHLNGPTSPGTVLSSLYDTDLDGTARGLDGGWDTGAFEFDSTGYTRPSAPSDVHFVTSTP